MQNQTTCAPIKICADFHGLIGLHFSLKSPAWKHTDGVLFAVSREHTGRLSTYLLHKQKGESVAEITFWRGNMKQEKYIIRNAEIKSVWRLPLLEKLYKNTHAMKTILYAFFFVAPNIFLSDSSESRSRSLKKMRSPGLGAEPQQAETRLFRGKRNGWVFAFVIQMHCLPVLC